jgi:mannose-6-phosphate isomerase-like protein (cupin superfamily)
MADGYIHRSLDELESNPEKPGERWEVSPTLGIESYNFNIAVLKTGERLSQNAYHYHENQEEFYHVIAGCCRVEVDRNSFDMNQDDVLVIEPGVNHLLHNPFESACKLIAIGAPPEGRYPVHQVQSFEQLRRERYENNE